jgi:hypothetical protein
VGVLVYSTVSSFTPLVYSSASRGCPRLLLLSESWVSSFTARLLLVYCRLLRLEISESWVSSFTPRRVVGVLVYGARLRSFTPRLLLVYSYCT